MATTDDLDRQKRAYRIWARYYDKVYVNMLSRAQREAVEAAVACGPEILEIGVGTGLTLAYFPKTCRVTGVDLSLDMLKVADAKRRERGYAHVIGLLCMDACRLAFDAEAFDAVTAQFVITLVPDPEQALDEMDRVLKPGGEIVISSRILTATGLAAKLWALLGPLAKAVGWSTDFHVDRLTGWAKRSGRYEVAHVGRGYFKVVRLRKIAGRAALKVAA